LRGGYPRLEQHSGERREKQVITGNHRRAIIKTAVGAGRHYARHLPQLLGATLSVGGIALVYFVVAIEVAKLITHKTLCLGLNHDSHSQPRVVELLAISLPFWATR